MSHVLPTKICKEETQQVGLFFKKGVLEFVIKIPVKYTNKVSKNVFLKLNFFTDNFQGL